MAPRRRRHDASGAPRRVAHSVAFSITFLLLICVIVPAVAWMPLRKNAPHACTKSALTMALQPPPVTDTRRLTLSWKEVAKRAAAGCDAAFRDGARRVSVDIPQISSVDRSTTARKFEDDNNFLLNLIEMLGGGRAPTPVGRQIQIMVGGFEGGGDYLSDEGLYGYRWNAAKGVVTAIGNSEIDSSALREVPQLDDGTGKILFFNVNLDRISFFDKIGMPKFNDVETAYVLRRVGPGFLSRQYPDDFCVWRLDERGKLELAASQSTPFKAQEAETVLRTRRT